MAIGERYATFANFGGGRKDLSTRPQIKKVVLAEFIKRRRPSKHYVYKMVVEWTSGTTSIVYRRYSMFFDFQVKLQELYQGLCQKNPHLMEKVPHLPELPGKILFGRSHIHQVAEKRRGKIEEFCQQVVNLPPEISHTNLVMGFFNTWPEDTMLPRHSESASPSTSSTIPTPRVMSTSSHTSSHTPLSAQNSTPFSPLSTSITSSTATEAVISHPDEMENLEQYTVLADYNRKDSHQVNLTEGQVVHVIEKHDTGWWMVMSDDEQGYAPAAYLEPVEGARRQHNAEQQEMESESSSEEYEAMESYSAQSEDEVTFKTGDTIQVLSKSMDGWWKIRCNNKVGLAPSALIRKPMELSQVPMDDDVIYESHKTIYAGLNIHRPPPRRNTIGRKYNHLIPAQQQMYAVPRSNPPLVKRATEPAISHTTAYDEADYVEPPLELTSEDEEDPAYYRVPRSLQSSMSDTTCNKWNGSLYSPPPREDSSQKRDSAGSSGGDPVIFPERDDVGGGIYDAVPEESPYELETVGTFVSPTSSSSTAVPVYTNANNARAGAESFKSSRSNSTELLSTSASAAVTGTGGWRQVDSVSPLISPSTSSPPPQTTSSSGQRLKEDADYVDIDQHDEYVDPEELMGGAESSAGDSIPPTSPPASFDLFKPLPKPPLPTSNPPKKKPKMGKSRSMSMDLSEDTAEDEYIPMDPIYTEPPPDEDGEQFGTPNPVQSQQQQQQQKQPKQSKTPTPSSSSAAAFFPAAPSQGGKQKRGYPKLKVARNKVQISSPVLVEMNNVGLSKAKSLESLLEATASGSREPSPQRHGSPHSERKASPARFPVLPPLPTAAGSGSKGKADDSTRVGISKPKLVKVKSTGKAGIKRNSEIPQVPHHVLTQSGSPPRDSASPEHRGVTHTTSVPIPPASAPTSASGWRQAKNERRHLKSYVAISSYQSSVSGSLTFQAGDKCVRLRMTPDGWWLVNIGGREGWAPEAYWKEEAWNQTTTIARPPGPAPTVSPILPPERKPRSHTVATDGVNSPLPAVSRQLEFTSSMEGSLETSSQSSWSGSVEVEQRSMGDAEISSRKPTPPPPPPQNTKPGRREPLLPKPKPGAGNPLRKKADRPPVPQKPNNISSSVTSGPKTTAHATSPSSSSPPLPRRRSEDTPSPPPPPLPYNLTQNQRRLNAVAQASSDASSTTANNVHSEYMMLENARTLDPLESSPWFVGKMERGSAEQFLMEHGRQREFLVRERAAKDGYYALSIRYHYSCKHFNIDPTGQGQYMIGNLTFPAIADIIHHYQNNSLFIHENQHVTLSSPARRRTRGSTDTRTHS